jgi:hypothetical protein
MGTRYSLKLAPNEGEFLLETGLGDPSEARTKKLARTAGWYEAQERGWQELQQIKREYREQTLAKDPGETTDS